MYQHRGGQRPQLGQSNDKSLRKASRRGHCRTCDSGGLTEPPTSLFGKFLEEVTEQRPRIQASGGASGCDPLVTQEQGQAVARVEHFSEAESALEEFPIEGDPREPGRPKKKHPGGTHAWSFENRRETQENSFWKFALWKCLVDRLVDGRTNKGP